MAAVTPRVRVGILTTRSVVIIQRIEPEAHSSRSVMCINRTAVETGVSRAYNKFVSPGTGVVSKLTGVNAFRMDVDGEVTDGRSFELPVLLGHMLRKERQLAGSDAGEPATALWLATGEVDADHRVNRVDGITQKLQALGAWLAHGPSDRPPVTIFLPAGNKADTTPIVAALQSPDVSIRFIERAEQAFDAAASGSSRDRSMAKLLGLAALVAIVLSVSGFALWRIDRPVEQETVAEAPAATTTDVPSASSTSPTPAALPAPASGEVIVSESYSQGSCYGGERQQRDHRGQLGGELALPAAARRCRIEARAANASGQAMLAYLVARDGIKLAPTFLGVNGSLTPQLATETTVLELAFSAEPLAAGADASRLARVVIRLRPNE